MRFAGFTYPRETILIINSIIQHFCDRLRSYWNIVAIARFSDHLRPYGNMALDSKEATGRGID